MSLPCGFNQAGLPIGLQMIGNYFKEAEMLQVADHYQVITDWHLKQPLQNAVGEKL
jgi:aspartyl-tRNA(Asn)/glutamyl-tRNA(Gln) amidotransferase subunit A